MRHELEPSRGRARVLSVELDRQRLACVDLHGRAAETLGLRFPLLLDRDSTVTAAWGVDVIPTSFLIGPDGAVAFHHVGEIDWSMSAERRRVEALFPR